MFWYWFLWMIPLGIIQHCWFIRSAVRQHWSHCMFLIHYKEPIHKNHLFGNQATLVVLCGDSFIQESDNTDRALCFWFTIKNWFISVIPSRIRLVLHVFDSFKRTNSEDSLVRESDHASCAACFWFSQKYWVCELWVDILDSCSLCVGCVSSD